MPYSTPAMVRSALVPSSDGNQGTNTNTAADLSDAQILDSINEADATIDGYLGKYYAVPVADVAGLIPHPIDYWSRNIAAYNATLAYRESQDFADTDPVARRYNATISALKAVAAGQVALQIPDNTSGNAETGAAAAFNPYIGDLFDPCDFDLSPSRDFGFGPGFGGFYR